MELNHSYGEGGHKPVVTVTASENGKQVGKTDVYISDRGLNEAHPFVEPEYRRRGLASRMYAYIEEKLGIVLSPARVQNRAGRAMWKRKRWRRASTDRLAASQSEQNLAGRRQELAMSKEDIKSRLRAQGCGCKSIDDKLKKAEAVHEKAEKEYLDLLRQAEAHKLKHDTKMHKDLVKPIENLIHRMHSDVVGALKGIKSRLPRDAGIVDVRLQVLDDGEWAVHYGPSDFDQDQRGYWGASSITKSDTAEHIKATATELLDQVHEAAHEQNPHAMSKMLQMENK
jgi:hypothetical protein